MKTSKLIKAVIGVSLLTAVAPTVNAGHESAWIFPNYSNATDSGGGGGVKGRADDGTVHQPQSWIDNNEFPTGYAAPVGKAGKMVLQQPQSWIQS